jgi:hypothetical protein
VLHLEEGFLRETEEGGQKGNGKGLEEELSINFKDRKNRGNIEAWLYQDCTNIYFSNTSTFTLHLQCQEIFDFRFFS